MKLSGSRIQIAGSAGNEADVELLRYSHRLVKFLTKSLYSEAASFVMEVGNEPVQNDNSHGVGLIFDWTILETYCACLSADKSKAPKTVLPIFTAATHNSLEKIPDRRKNIWNRLLTGENVYLEHIPEGWTSGAIRRQHQSLKGDILICISGGEGVEHLATLYRSQNKPVIALDLNLGSSRSDKAGGGFRIFQKMRTNPSLFFELADAKNAGVLIEGCRTLNGKKNGNCSGVI